MSILSLNSLTPLQALLFSADDILNFGPGLSGNDLAVTNSGLTTSLNLAGLSLQFPATSLFQSGNAGLISFSDGTHLFPGTANADTFGGTSGNDRQYGGDGDDRFASGDGHDWIFGGAGRDTMYGGAGNDHIYGQSATGGVDGDDQIMAEAGNDYVQGNAGNDWIEGGDGNDRLYGGQDADTIYGGAGNDQINGNYGDDQAFGGDGNDSIRGGKGSDILRGDGGDDTLSGDLGSDTMTGGAGADLFRIGASDAPIISTNTLVGDIETITDFTHGEDHIQLAYAPTSIVYGTFNSPLGGLLGFVQQLLDGHVGQNEVASVAVGNDTYLVFQGAGGLLADSVVALQGVNSTSMTLSDFV